MTEPGNNKKKLVIISGMHRSGTSCLAGSLQEMGLFLGNVVTSAPHNKKGNRENKSLYLLHEKVLMSQGASWDKPKVVNKWLPEHMDELQEIIETYSNYPQWGFKDPRVLFTLQGWLATLPEDSFTFVASLRHPVKVAASLSKRNGFTQAAGFALWELYNKQLLTLMQAYPIKLINFDLEEQDYKQSLESLLPEIMLEIMPEIIKAKQLTEGDSGGKVSGENSFYEKKLINQHVVESLPAQIDLLYQALLDKAL